MRVLSVIPGPVEGHSMIFSKRLVVHTQQAGVETEIFFLQSRSPGSFFRERKKLKRKIKEFAPDLIHSHYGTYTALLCASVCSVPMIVSFIGSDINRNRSDGFCRSFLGHLMSHLSIFRARKIICVSDGIYKRLWWGKRKAVVQTFGIDTEKFSLMDGGEARGKLNWIPDEKIVVFYHGGQAGKRKDIADAVMEIVRRKLPEARMEILNGQYPEDLFVCVLNASDCLLVCSDSEGSPTIVKEAMACNLPVVTTPVGDVMERLQGTDWNFVTPQEPEKLAECVLKVLMAKERSGGRERIMTEGISERQVAEKFVLIYKSCIRKNA